MTRKSADRPNWEPDVYASRWQVIDIAWIGKHGKHGKVIGA